MMIGLSLIRRVIYFACNPHKVVKLVVIEISQDVLGRFEDGEFQRLQGWDVDLRHDDTILDRGYGSLVSPLSFFFSCVTLLNSSPAIML
jgi:hypothetical protein